MNKKFFFSLVFLAAGIRLGLCQGSTQVDWTNGAATLFRDQNGVALTQGAAGPNNDGALVQLGYFSAATMANNFAGTWIPLTGFGTLLPRTTIGDSPDNSGLGNGRIGMSTGFDFGTDVVRVYEPAAGDTGAYTTQSSITITGTAPPSSQILAIRFYNAAGNLYNTVSSDSTTWQWQSPSLQGSQVFLDLVNTALEFESFPVFGAGGDFRTVIAIPEPSTFALFGVGIIGLIAARRRAKKISA